MSLSFAATIALSFTPTTIEGIVLFIFALILLALPGRSGFARFIKFILFLGVVGASGYNLYTTLTQTHAFFVPVAFAPSYFSSLASVNLIFVPTTSLSPAYTFFDYLGAASNAVSLITGLIGLFKELRGDSNRPAR